MVNHQHCLLLAKTCIYVVFQNKSCGFFFSDPPGRVTISPSNDTFYTKRYGKPLHDITCEADCLPECTYMWLIVKYPYIQHYATGNNLFATESFDFLRIQSNKFFCRASNNIDLRSYSDSTRITVETKGMNKLFMCRVIKISVITIRVNSQKIFLH